MRKALAGSGQSAGSRSGGMSVQHERCTGITVREGAGSEICGVTPKTFHSKLQAGYRCSPYSLAKRSRTSLCPAPKRNPHGWRGWRGGGGGLSARTGPCVAEQWAAGPASESSHHTHGMHEKGGHQKPVSFGCIGCSRWCGLGLEAAWGAGLSWDCAWISFGLAPQQWRVECRSGGVACCHGGAGLLHGCDWRVWVGFRSAAKTMPARRGPDGLVDKRSGSFGSRSGTCA